MQAYIDACKKLKAKSKATLPDKKKTEKLVGKQRNTYKRSNQSKSSESVPASKKLEGSQLKPAHALFHRCQLMNV